MDTQIATAIATAIWTAAERTMSASWFPGIARSASVRTAGMMSHAEYRTVVSHVFTNSCHESLIRAPAEVRGAGIGGDDSSLWGRALLLKVTPSVAKRAEGQFS